jgi:hypothetical protein
MDGNISINILLHDQILIIYQMNNYLMILIISSPDYYDVFKYFFVSLLHDVSTHASLKVITII